MLSLLKSIVEPEWVTEHKEKWKSFDPRVFTPDVAKLCQYKHQRLFVCDELMSDRRMHWLIEEDVIKVDGLRACVTAFTKDRFNYLINPEGIALPIPVDPTVYTKPWRTRLGDPPTTEGCLIQGELLVVRPNIFWEKLDKLKLNGVHFVRRRLPILDPYRYMRVQTDKYINNGYYDELGRELPPLLSGRKGKEYILGDEWVYIQSAWVYMANPSYWDYQFKRRPEIFDRVPRFTPRKDKQWLSEYFHYQTPKDPKDS